MKLLNDNLLPLLSDFPAAELDLLHFDRYVRPIADLISAPQTQTPLTLGIYGCWGSGKTTLMQFIRKALPPEKFLHVSFNPWIYRSEKNLIVPLLHTIHNEFRKSPLKKFNESAKRVAYVTTRLAAAITLKTLTASLVSLEDVDGEIQKINQKRNVATSSIGSLREELRTTIDRLTSSNHRIVIYVDDLDRCLPDQVVDLLEGIKLFLDLPNTIVLIAVDPEIVAQGVETHYRDFHFKQEKQASLTSDYLDKMIQLWISLNPLRPAETCAYVSGLIDQMQLALTPGQLDWLTHALLPNPRKIKRILNVLALYRTMDVQRPNQIPMLDFDLMMRLILLQQQWPFIYARVRAYPRMIDALCDVNEGRKSLSRREDWVALKAQMPEIVSWCEETLNSGGPQLKTLLKPPSVFVGADFQPYFEQLG